MGQSRKTPRVGETTLDEIVDAASRQLCRGVIASLTMVLLCHVTVTGAQSLSGRALSCPAGSPSGNQVVPALLGSLTTPLNTAWAAQAAAKIDPLGTAAAPVTQNGIPIPCNSSLQQYCSVYYGGSCQSVHADITLYNLKGLEDLKFTSSTATQFNLKDVAAHSARGPDASKLTDGVFAAEGHSSTDPAFAIVLPHSPNDLSVAAGSGLVVDLGATYTVCGSSSSGCKSGPMLQADNDDVYQLEWSTDGTTFTKYGVFQTVSGSGLRTRGVATIKSGSVNGNFQARYLRVYGISGGATYAVSELQVWDNGGNLISVGKPSVGPRPYQITDGTFAQPGQSSTDTQYAVVLRHLTGPSSALAIDLGEVKSICGNGYDCLNGPQLQADNDDVYQLDYSSDGFNWATYGEFPACCSSGLRTRAASQTTPGVNNPSFKARYLRVYAVSGGDTFAVSQLGLWDTASNPIAAGAATWGPEPVITDGVLAPAGTAWNNSNYAFILPSCRANPNSVCPSSAAGSLAQTAYFQVDLGAPYPIDHVLVQADQAHEFEIDASTDGQSWSFLGVVPMVGGSGLQTRTVGPFQGRTARYLRIFGVSGTDTTYSVSSMQVFTPQANTACGYDSGANVGENFACSYDGMFQPTLATPQGSNGALPVTFFLESASIKVTCVHLDKGGNELTNTDTVSDAHNRNCSDQLPLNTATPNANYCAGFCASGQPQALLSYAQLVDNSLEFVPTNGTNLFCDGGNIDSGILPLTDSFVAGLATDAATGLFNGILNYKSKPNSLVPFPPPPQTTPPTFSACPALASEPPPPTPLPDNITGLDGRAQQVGGTLKNATLSISGRFTAQAPVALDQATVTIDALLQEAGVGELVGGPSGTLLVPLSIYAKNGSKPDKGLYTTPPAAKPIVRMQIRPAKANTAGGAEMDFSIDVEGATIANPSRCAAGSPVARLATGFVLIGGSASPIRVHATAEWQCDRKQLITSVAR